MAEIDIFIDAAPVSVAVDAAPIDIEVSAAQGPAGPTGSAGTTTWSGITDKPIAFPPSTHTHTTSEVFDGVGTSLQVVLNSKAPLASPSFTGTPIAPTAATTTNTTQLATTAFVQQELAAGTAVAKNLEVYVRNMTGASMPAGTIVYINATNGNRPTITKAQANSDANSAQTFGFTKTSIADNGFGFVIVSGEVENINTNGLGGGTQLYLSPSVAGNWTTTKPAAPEHLVYVGIVVRDHPTQGIILVAIQNGYELEELHDVSITAPVAAKQVIKRNAGNTLWINSAIVSADVSDATSAATPNTLVLRDITGQSSFDIINTSSLSSEDGIFSGNVRFEGLSSSIAFNTTTYTYGSLAASAAHRTALGSGGTGDQLFTADTPVVAREVALNEILKYDATAQPTLDNPTQWVSDPVLSVNLTAGLWEISYFLRFNLGTCGLTLRLLFGTPASVDMVNGNTYGAYTRGNQNITSHSYVSSPSTISFTGVGTGTALTGWSFVGFVTVILTGNTTLGLQYARSSTGVAGQTITRLGNVYIRARKIND